MVSIRRLLLIAVTATVFFTGMDTVQASNWSVVQEVYVVKSHDTVESIAREYMKKNTYGPREEREFAEGIRQLNDMKPGEEVTPGQELKISYWIKVEE